MGNAQLKDIDDGGEDFVDELKPGTKLLHGQYEIERFLNAGGFGITYLAKDSLDRKIVIKECFPGAFCRRSKTIVQARSRAHQPELKSIVRLFVQEARSLAKLDHPNIVGVHQVFEDNDTAYMALDFVEGRDLLDTLEDPNHGLNPAQIKSILTDILGAVGFIHDQSILHRDISPDNILIDGNLRPVLIDFGAAREQATKQSRVLSALRVVKDGYSPQEFYIAGSEQSPSSDLYALGASFYHLIANEVPPNSQARLAAIATGEKDPYVTLSEKAKGYDNDFVMAIDKSLKVLPKDRVQSAQEWLDMMKGKAPKAKKVAPAVAAQAEKPKSKMPMLMASVAVVALIGVGVLTQTDILTPTSEKLAAAAEQDAVVAPVEETTTAAATVEDTPVVAAPVVAEPAPSSLLEALAAAGPDTSVETPPVVDAAPVVDAEPVIEEAPVVEVAPVVEEAPVVVEAPVVEAAPEPVVAVAENTPAVDEVPLVDALTTSDTGLVDISLRPTLRPEAAAPVTSQPEAPEVAIAETEVPEIATVTEAEVPEIAAVTEPEVQEVVAVTEPEPAPLPEPEITPQMIRDVAQTPILPGFLANVPDVPTMVVPELALPVAPEEIAAEEVAIAFSAPALEPGNEIVETPPVVETAPVIVANDGSVSGAEDRTETAVAPTIADSSKVLSAWSVELPFAASATNVIGDVEGSAPDWVQDGTQIVTVNGIGIDRISDINATLRENVILGDSSRVLVTFGLEKDGGLSIEETALPIVQNFQLLNGIGFQATFDGTVWKTVVTAVPDTAGSELQVGDELIADISSDVTLDQRLSLKNLLDDAIAAGRTQFSFAVNRDDSIWVAGLAYDPKPVSN